MRCMLCDREINWDNSYGHGTHTCVCRQCFMELVARKGGYLYTTEVLNKLIEVGKVIENARAELLHIKK